MHGIKRRASSLNTQRIDHIYEDPHSNHASLKLHCGDLTTSSNLTRIVSQVQPDEVYNLAAQSHMAVSFEAPECTADVDGMGLGYAWLDTGTHGSLLDAGNFVRTLAERQGPQVGSSDEIAFQQGWISSAELGREAEEYAKNGYGDYLKNLSDWRS